MAAAVALFLAVLFEDAVFRGRVFFDRDIGAWWHPTMVSVQRMVREGTLPFWNPGPGFGMPLLANPNFQLAYPPTWLVPALGPAAYFRLFVVAHAALAAGGTLLLARTLGASRPAALVAALLWTGCGPLLSSVSMYHHFASACWMPWVLAALWRLVLAPTAGRAAALAAASALQLLAGSADLVFMTALFALPVSLLGWRAREAPPVPRIAVALALAALGAVGGAAVQWGPTFAAVRATPRTGLGAGASLYWSLHPLALGELVAPRLLGALPLSDAARALLFESREPLLVSLYLGVATVGLVVLALATRAGRWLGALFVLFLVLALGRHAPLLPLLVEWPPFSMFRYPGKYLLPASLAWALLAGLGVDAWPRASAVARRAAVAVLLLVAALAGAAAAGVALDSTRVTRHLKPAAAPEVPATVAATLAGTALVAAVAAALVRAGGPRARGALAVLAVLDALRTGRAVNPLADPLLFLHRPRTVEAIAAEAPDARVYATVGGLGWLNDQLVRGPGGWPPSWSFALGMQDALLAPLAQRWGFRGSYDGAFTGLEPNAYVGLSGAVNARLGTPDLVHALRRAGVTHVVALRPGTLALPEVVTVASAFREPVRVYRVPDPLPVARVVGTARVLDGERALAAVLDPAFDAGRAVVLPEGPQRAAAAFHGRAVVRERRADRLAVDVEASDPGYLVLAEAHDPGWTAEVDGVPAPVLRADVAFRAVAVPAGRHLVTQRYRPPALVPSAVASAASWLALAATGLAALRRRVTSSP